MVASSSVMVKRITAFFLLAALCCGVAGAQQGVPSESVYVTAIEVVADVRDGSGNVPDDLTIRPARAGLTVRVARWLTEHTSQDFAASRTIALLRDEASSGELPTTVAIRWNTTGASRRRGELNIRASTTPLATIVDPHRRVFRVTIAAQERHGRVFTTHRVVTAPAPATRSSTARRSRQPQRE
jgi:hypothetical protein